MKTFSSSSEFFIEKDGVLIARATRLQMSLANSNGDFNYYTISNITPLISNPIFINFDIYYEGADCDYILSGCQLEDMKINNEVSYVSGPYVNLSIVGPKIKFKSND